jgi:hypothetical protein
MRSWVRVLWMVLGGFIGAYAGYWIGYLLGWSSDAEWPLKVGGGTGAILLSIAMSVLGVSLVRLMVGPKPDRVDNGRIAAAEVTPPIKSG